MSLRRFTNASKKAENKLAVGYSGFSQPPPAMSMPHLVISDRPTQRYESSSTGNSMSLSKGPLRTPDKKKSKVPMNTYNEMVEQEASQEASGSSPRTPPTSPKSPRLSTGQTPSPNRRAFAPRSDSAKVKTEKRKVNLTSASARISQHRGGERNFGRVVR